MSKFFFVFFWDVEVIVPPHEVGRVAREADVVDPGLVGLKGREHKIIKHWACHRIASTNQPQPQHSHSTATAQPQHSTTAAQSQHSHSTFTEGEPVMASDRKHQP